MKSTSSALVFSLALFSSTLVPSAASAANWGENDPLAWDFPWSHWRWLIALALVVTVWLLCFHVWFPNRLDPETKSAPPWPRAAFGDSLAVFILGSCAAFLIVFGLLSDDIFLSPRNLGAGGTVSRFLGRNYFWIGVGLLGVGLAALVRFSIFRHRED